MAAPALHRFLAKIQVGDGCWEWQSPVGRNGYGQFTWNGRNGLPHRYAHEFFIGPIPEGMQVDHLCFNRICVRPDHLEAVTPQVNTRRSKDRITHCPQGHEYSQDNLIAARSGKRLCKACARAWYHRNKKVS